MSRIELEQISENEVEVVLPSNTPMEMVTQLVKGLNDRGLYEDLSKSTLSVRYFVREEQVEDVADKLIKSLQRLTKDEELPYWHPKSQFANQKRVREMEIAERRAKNGIKQPTNLSTAPEPMVMPDTAPKMPAPAATTGQSTLSPAGYTAPFPKMVDTNPSAMNTAGGTGKRYAYINDPVSKEEDVEKSNYGPKGKSQYSVADNIRRKANNTGDQTGFGSNTNTKQYTSAKFSNQTPQTDPKLKQPQPVKQWSKEQIAAEQAKRNGLKKSWGQHLPFPSAEEEIMKLAKNMPVDGETEAANRLSQLMSGKGLLGQQPPAQPTDEQMFGHLVVTEEMEKNADRQWQGAAFDWLKEAQKPISQKFASEADELAYWDSIKIADRDDGKSGY